MTADQNVRPPADPVLTDIATYVADDFIESELAFSTARYCLMDAIGCGILALRYPECKKVLGPIVEGTHVPQGSRVPGTNYELDPVQAAFNIGSIIRWLDFNDTWLAAEWGHPSDNLGAILAVADYVSRKNKSQHKPPLRMKDVLISMIKAYEIQGIIALENSFNRVGLDHVALVKTASAAVAMQLWGGKKEDIINVLSHVFIDGQSLRTYRHAPNTGPRKSWAAGDACARAVRLADLVLKGQIGYPSALTAKTWGFYDVLFHGKPFHFSRGFGSYVMENILFKISFPAEFHAQTAVECAIQLHPEIIHRIDAIEKIKLTTQESAIRIISKTGQLYNPADRDHCLQYMTAVGLLFGNLKADYYENAFAKDPRIDFLREKMEVEEDPILSQDYLDPNKRSIGNSVQIFFKDGTFTKKIQVDYPIGHRRRREEGIPLLVKKFEDNVSSHFSSPQIKKMTELFLDLEKLKNLPVDEWMSDLIVLNAQGL